MNTPRIIETGMHFGGGGKVAIIDFGKVSSDYSMHISRKYAVPEDWTEEQVAEFELAKLAELRATLDPLLDHEFNVRFDQHVWESETKRGR
jgi:hypothetical protein